MKLTISNNHTTAVTINREWINTFTSFSIAISTLLFNNINTKYGTFTVIIPSKAKNAIILVINNINKSTMSCSIEYIDFTMCVGTFTEITGIKPKSGIIKINIKYN